MQVVDDVDVQFVPMKDNNEMKDEPRRKMKHDKASTKKQLKRERRERFMESLHQQECLVAELKRRVFVLEEEVAYEKGRRIRPQDAEHNVGHEALSISPAGISLGGISPGGISPGGMPTDPPTTKTYVRKGSRRRYKSISLRTPYVGLLGKKNE